VHFPASPLLSFPHPDPQCCTTNSPSPRTLTLLTTILGEQEPSSLLEVSCPRRDIGSIPPTILLLALEIIWAQRISILIHTWAWANIRTRMDTAATADSTGA